MVLLKNNNNDDDDDDDDDSLCRYDEGGIIGWGKTQIFMKKPQTLFTLESARERKLPAIATIIQLAFRKCVRHACVRACVRAGVPACVCDS